MLSFESSWYFTMSVGPPSGAYRIYGYSHQWQLGSTFTAPGSPPPNNLWPVNGHPQDSSTIAYFHLTKLANGRYHISLASAPVVSSDGLLYANVSAEEPLVEWKVESVPQHGQTAHLISGPTNDPSSEWKEGWWISPDSLNEQTRVQGPFISTPSIPPYFPSWAVFDLDRLD
ncbi:hypothetical protein NMY22_g2967 [Coprinellus aureogranulatus]|nr:hypothetical protein NMY22_g2967 [Coprinellus aureogranulatus]